MSSVIWRTFPKEFGLDKQVDYDLQFSKSFLDPFKVIMDTIGWQPEKVASLEFLFDEQNTFPYQNAFGFSPREEKVFSIKNQKHNGLNVP